MNKSSDPDNFNSTFYHIFRKLKFPIFCKLWEYRKNRKHSSADFMMLVLYWISNIGKYSGRKEKGPTSICAPVLSSPNPTKGPLHTRRSSFGLWPCLQLWVRVSETLGIKGPVKTSDATSHSPLSTPLSLQDLESFALWRDWKHCYCLTIHSVGS